MSTITETETTSRTPARPIVKNYRNMEDGLAPGDELLRIEGLQMHFPITKGFFIQRQVGAVQAVDGVSFTIKKGETLGLGGRVGLRQEHHGPGYLAAVQAYSGQRDLQGDEI